VALLGLVIWRSRIWEAGATLGVVSGLPLLAALVLAAAPPFLWAIRSAHLLESAGDRVPVGALVPMTTFANTINNLTPGSVGEFVRLYLLRIQLGVGYSTGGAVILIERFVALAYLTASSLVAWIAVQAHVAGPVIIAVLAAVAVGPGVSYRFGLRPIAWLAAAPLARVAGLRASGLVGALLTAEGTIARLLTDPLVLLRFAIVSAALFAVMATQLMLVADALGVALEPLAAWGALGLAVTAGVLSLLPFGLGAADIVLVALLGALGIAAAPATAIAFGYRLVATLPVTLAGVASYAWLSVRMPESGLAGAAASARAGLEAGAPGAGEHGHDGD
jgi:uncharacterized membrane protein YbhN (UPF0104 family)